MNMYYFAEDGNYGDANNLLVVDGDIFTPEQWQEIEDSTDTTRLEYARSVSDSWTADTVVLCDGCGQPMLPNVSTLDDEGCAWICLTLGCSDYTAEELEFEDLTAVGVPYWVANQITKLIESLVN
jgi:hypothetical protein